MDTNGTKGNGSNGDAKLGTLLKKEAALRAAIAAEKVRRQKRAEKDDARMNSIVGRVAVVEAEQDSDLKARIRAAMQKAELAEGEAKLARSKGWL
jgi:hypothetical protein